MVGGADLSLQVALGWRHAAGEQLHTNNKPSLSSSPSTSFRKNERFSSVTRESKSSSIRTHGASALARANIDRMPGSYQTTNHVRRRGTHRIRLHWDLRYPVSFTGAAWNRKDLLLNDLTYSVGTPTVLMIALSVIVLPFPGGCNRSVP